MFPAASVQLTLHVCEPAETSLEYVSCVLLMFEDEPPKLLMSEPSKESLHVLTSLMASVALNVNVTGEGMLLAPCAGEIMSAMGGSVSTVNAKVVASAKNMIANRISFTWNSAFSDRGMQ